MALTESAREFRFKSLVLQMQTYPSKTACDTFGRCHDDRVNHYSIAQKGRSKCDENIHSEPENISDFEAHKFEGCSNCEHRMHNMVIKDTVYHKDKELFGHCESCGEKIVGQVLMALGKMWHKEHFICYHCGMKLSSNIFYEAEGKAYCERDYISLFSPKCAYCNEPILEEYVIAMNRPWHTNHFLCCCCEQPITDGGYHEMNGLIYCSLDFYDLFAPKCYGCSKPVSASYLTALHHHWHVDCFACFECGQPFTSGSFYDQEGRPLCERHHDILKKGLCASCNQPIIGPFITAIGKKYHPGHFACAFCLQSICLSTFKEHGSKPYCHQCYDRLIG